MPSTSSSIAVGWSPFGSYSRLDLEAHAAFGFLRARRPVRRPHLELAVVAAEFRPALADQVFQRLRGGLDAERFHLVARRTRQRCRHPPPSKPKLPRQFRIERRDGGRGAVIGLRRFVEARLRARASSAADWPAAASLRIACESPSASRPARDARRPRRRSGGPTNCPAAAAGRCPSRGRLRRA